MFSVPYPIIFVLLGLAAGALRIVHPDAIGHEIIMFLFLPPLLFEAAWNLNVAELKRGLTTVTLLATVGVLASMLLTATVMVQTQYLTWSTGLIFGAIVAATDPVSVVAVFRKLGVDGRLTALVEGESLLNDGTAVALFTIVLSAGMNDGHTNWVMVPMQFLSVILGGITIGAGFGWLAEQLLRRWQNDIADIALTVLVAYASFWISEKLGTSAVLAVVAAAVVMGTYGQRDLSRKIWIEIDDFWTVIAMIVNSAVFFLIGIHAKAFISLNVAVMICCGIVATLLSRLPVVWILCSLTSTRVKPISAGWQAVIYWGGLRGALSMVMVLSLPETLPAQQQLLELTFGVVLFTLLVQGLTVQPLIQLLRLKSPSVVPPEAAAQSHQ